MILEATGLSKSYGTLQVLKNVDLSISEGEFVCVMGPSGSGKSTLLHVVSALDSVDKGEVTIEGKNLLKMADDDLSRFRRTRLGFIFQFFNLLPSLTALENVCLPMLLDGHTVKTATPLALAMLDQVGLKDRSHHRPNQLSGGQMQRVAIARALLARPALLMADEPTGNLDSKTGTEVLELLRKLSKTQTILMVTHDPKAAEYATRIVRMKDGSIESDSKFEPKTKKDS